MTSLVKPEITQVNAHIVDQAWEEENPAWTYAHIPLGDENPSWIPLEEENPAWDPLEEENPAWDPLEEEAPASIPLQEDSQESSLDPPYKRQRRWSNPDLKNGAPLGYARIQAPTPQSVYKDDALRGIHGFVTASSFWRKAEAWKALMHEIQDFPGSFAALKIDQKRKLAQKRLAITKAKQGDKRELKRAERNRELRRRYVSIVEQLGPANNWPAHIRKLLWIDRHLNYAERFQVLLFAITNGLNSDILVGDGGWFRIRNLISDEKTYQHMKHIIADIETPNDRSKHWHAFNMHRGHDLTIEGKLVSKIRRCGVGFQ